MHFLMHNWMIENYFSIWLVFVKICWIKSFSIRFWFMEHSVVLCSLFVCSWRWFVMALFMAFKSGINRMFCPHSHLMRGIWRSNLMYLLRLIISRICSPGLVVAFGVAMIINILCLGNRNCDVISISTMFSVPFLFLVPAYLFENRNLEMISIFLALYYYGCIFAYFAIVRW